MKKLIALTLVIVSTMTSCRKFDDSLIWEELRVHEERILRLETLCNQINTNIASLQTIVIALQNHDYITNVSLVMEDGKEIGYVITFAQRGAITIYHGQDGANGAPGADPDIIGVKKHTDGKYYWTRNGEWILDDNGNMLCTSGTDGANGVSPRLKIDNGCWFLSYDNGRSWENLGPASPEDCVVENITHDDQNVYISLRNGEVIVISKKPGLNANVSFDDPYVRDICLYWWDADFDGNLSYAELANVTDVGDVFTKINTKSYSKFVNGSGYSYYTVSLEHGNAAIRSLDVLKDFTSLVSLSGKAFSGDYNLSSVVLPDSLEEIQDGFDCYIIYPSKTDNFSDVIISLVADHVGAFSFTAISKITLPASLKKIGKHAFYGCDKLRSIYSNAATPPQLVDKISETVTVYVPNGTLELYTSDSKWNTAKAILEMPN